MAAAMHGNLEIFQLLLARSTNLHAEAPCADGRDLLGFALDGENPEIIKTVIERLPQMPQWTNQYATRSECSAASREQAANPITSWQTCNASDA